MLRTLGVSLASLGSALLTPALSQSMDVTLHGSFIERIKVGPYTYEGWQLAPGSSSGSVLEADNTFSIRAVDNRDLGFYFSRANGPSAWDVDLGLWRNDNSVAPDFFLFEYGGDESVQVAPRFPDGSLGQAVTLNGWEPVGYQAFHGANRLQQAEGLYFEFSDLRDGSGERLAPSQVITGLRFFAPTLDGAVFLAHDSNPAPGGPGETGTGRVTLTPREPLAWETLELSYSGPWASSTANAPNPFLDYRLTVRFDGPRGESIIVPGFFDGDGEGGLEGFVWRARFRPPVAGLWTATASMRQGEEVAISTLPGAGVTGFLDGAVLDFFVGLPDPAPKQLLPQRYTGEHYPRDARDRPFIKGGCNSPENFLAYRGFVGVEKGHQGIGILHDYPTHRPDWNPGDAVFRSDVHDMDSKGILGALNYLGSVGVNSQFAMLMNLGGDGQDVHPFLGPRPDAWHKRHYHPGRLQQWNVVFEHAARQGISMHFGLAETENANETWLDGGELGVERKLFYREVAARFAHLPAIKWTLCEETDFYSPQDLRDFANYLTGQDPYDHPVAFHNNTNDLSLYEAVAGDPEISATSQQYQDAFASFQAEYLREISAAAGHPWIVQFDEVAPASTGLSTTNASFLRKVALYDVLLSGAHVEWYMGWINNPGGGDLNVEDFRTREEMWDYMRYARRFLQQETPFWRLQPLDDLVSGEDNFAGGAQVFAAPGEIYVVYYPEATATGQLDLTDQTGRFLRRWWNPRTGTFSGGFAEVDGGQMLNMGPPPTSPGEDWLALVRRPDLPYGTTP